MTKLADARQVARRTGALLGALSALAVCAVPANAEVKAEPLPKGERGSCELKTFTSRQVVEMIYTNVVRTSPQTLDEMGKHVAPDIVFKDPVSSTRGWPAYRKVYEQFIGADQLYYKILDWSCSGRTVYANWVFGMKNQYTNNQYVEFEGVSKLVLDANDKLVLNLDNWNEIPPGYAGSLRSGDKGGVELE
jgi:hypothetical protein